MGEIEDKAKIHWFDRLQEESDVRRDQTFLREADLNLRFVRGDQWPGTPPGIGSPDSMQYKFVMNVVARSVKRKTALLTDSRPGIEVLSRAPNRRGTAETFKGAILAMYDEQSLEQQFAHEIARAITIGTACAVPVFDPTLDYGRGDVAIRFYDPRFVSFDPSVTRATQMHLAEFTQVRDVLPVNLIREMYPNRGGEVEASTKWSTYDGRPSASPGAFGRVLSAMQRVWKGDSRTGELSGVPRAELRHTWYKDFQRDDRGEAKFGIPRVLRHGVDAEGVLLVDESFPYIHGRHPLHLFDWDIEHEHPWGVPEVSGMRRIQYSLNRLVGQIMENTLLTNRVIVQADTDALDAKTWTALTSMANGLILRTKLGRKLTVTNPAVLPPHLLTLVELLMGGVDVVSGLSEASHGDRPPGIISGAAISELQQAAQSIVRLEARAFEDWLARIFQQVLALIWSYYTTDRLLQLLGPSGDLLTFEFERSKFLQNDEGGTMPEDAWQDFRFRIVPGSSLASTRVQRGVMAANLYQLGLLPGSEVLRASEWPAPDETVKLARKERAELGPLAVPHGGKQIRVPGMRAGGR
mgnify:FL=1